MTLYDKEEESLSDGLAQLLVGRDVANDLSLGVQVFEGDAEEAGHLVFLGPGRTSECRRSTSF